MKANFLKLTLFISFLFVGISVNAQQTLCTLENETYTVDDDSTATPPITPSPDGSYAWTLTDGAGADVTPSDITGQGTNSIGINWGNGSFSAPSTYTLTVVETVNGCPGEPQILTIELIQGYIAPVITQLADLCNDLTNGNGNFELTGGSVGADVAYEITSDNASFTTLTGTVTLDGSGNGTVAVPALTDPNTPETFTLALTSIDDDGSDSCDALDIDPDITESVTVNPTPITTPIGTN